MKPAPFAYVRAKALADVFDLLEQHGDGARILAGGQSLLPTLNMRLSAPDLLIDINGLSELSGIRLVQERGQGRMRIGALTRHAEVEHSADIARHVPLLARAMPHVGHAAIRNRGTMGGSLAFGDPAAEMPACALALDAEFVLAGRKGERRVKAGEFYKGLYETDLAPGEILTAVEFPATAADERAGFGELCRRHGDYAMAGLAALGKIEAGRIAALRLAYFGVDTRPVLASGAAKAVIGRVWNAETASAAQAALAGDLNPPGDLNASGPMKLHLARMLLGRVIGEMTRV